MHPLFSSLFFVPFLFHYKYLLLFLGLFFGGDTALLVGIYFSITGVMSFWAVIVLTLAASLAADLIWYGVGMLVSYRDLKRLPYFRSHQDTITALERFLDKHALKTLFYSKFVYGTRTVIQIMCGVHRVDFWEYVGVNTVGTFLWIAIFVTIGTTINLNLQAFRHVAHGIEFTFLGLIIVIIAVTMIIKRFFVRDLRREECEASGK